MRRLVIGKSYSTTTNPLSSRSQPYSRSPPSPLSKNFHNHENKQTHPSPFSSFSVINSHSHRTSTTNSKSPLLSPTSPTLISKKSRVKRFSACSVGSFQLSSQRNSNDQIDTMRSYFQDYVFEDQLGQSKEPSSLLNLLPQQQLSPSISSIEPQEDSLSSDNSPKMISTILMMDLFLAKCVDCRITAFPSQLLAFSTHLFSTLINKELNLSGLLLRLNSARVIARIILSSVNDESSRAISKINLHMNILEDEGIGIICDAINARESLEIVHLDVSNNRLSSSGIMRVINCVRVQNSIVSLDISSYCGENRNKFEHESCILLGELLGESQTLQFLKMANGCIGFAGLFSLSSGLIDNSSLVQLDISRNNFGDSEQVAKVLETVLSKQKTLIQLNLSSNELGNNVADGIGRALKPNISMCSIHELNLSKNSITTSGARMLFDNISRNSFLRTLILDENQIDDSIPEIMKFLEENTSLEILSLNKCCITQSGALYLSIGISHNSTLKTLLLNQNPIRNEGASQLANSLGSATGQPFNRTLKKLELSRCGIDDTSGVLLASIFRQNKSLREVNLSQNLFTDVTGAILLKYMQDNSNIHSVQLGKNLLTLEMMREITKRLHVNDQIRNAGANIRLQTKVNNLTVVKMTDDTIESQQQDMGKLLLKLQSQIEFLEQTLQIKLMESKERNSIGNQLNADPQRNELNAIQDQSREITKNSIEQEKLNDLQKQNLAEQIEILRKEEYNCRNDIIRYKQEIESKKNCLKTKQNVDKILKRRSMFTSPTRRSSIIQGEIVLGNGNKQILLIAAQEAVLNQLIRENEQTEEDLKINQAMVDELRKKVLQINNNIAFQHQKEYPVVQHSEEKQKGKKNTRKVSVK